MSLKLPKVNKSICAKAFAKLNLNLKITGKRQNGYHTLSSVMQSVSLSDTIFLSVSPGFGISLECEGFSSQNENILTKTAEMFLKAVNKKAHIKIKLIKNIPVLAGIGGGSADVAALLNMLSFIFCYPLDENSLKNLALKLGSDVPFCLEGGTKLVGGIGEEIEPFPAFKKSEVVLIKEFEKTSTAEMYQKFDKANPDIIDLYEGEVYDISPGFLKNDFLAVSPYKNEQEKICNHLLELGASHVGLTGSGPTVFGIFDFIKNDIKERIKAKYKNVYFCNTCESGMELIRTSSDKADFCTIS